MSEFVYVVRNWDQYFEIAESKQRHSLRWLATPTKHDGLGYRRMMKERDGPALFGAWNAIIQVAAKSGPLGVRGRLERDGRALDGETIALMTGFPVNVMNRALSFFSDPKQGWLDKSPVVTGAKPPNTVNASPAPPDGTPDVPTRASSTNGHHTNQSGRDPDHIRTSPATGHTGQDRQETYFLCAEPAKPASAPPVMTFPVIGSSTDWPLTTTKVAEWQDIFPFDIVPECKLARQWLIENPTRRKTATGMAKYLLAWLARRQNRGGTDTGRPEMMKASLGALQLRIEEIENDIRSILYPGGCAFAQEPIAGSREAKKLAELRAQKSAIKQRIESFGLRSA